MRGDLVTWYKFTFAVWLNVNLNLSNSGTMSFDSVIRVAVTTTKRR